MQKNSTILMAGTAFNMILQAVSVIWLGKYYISEFWGIFEYFGIAYSVFLIIATGRYELAIMLPKDDNDGYMMALLSAGCSILFSAGMGIILLIARFIFRIDLDWVAFLPIVISVLGIYYSSNYWLNRKKEYVKLAINRVIQGILYVFFNIAYAFILPSRRYGLVLGYTTAQGVVAAILLVYMLIDYKKLNIKVSFSRIKQLALEYNKFPKISAPSGVINTIALKLPAILLGFFSSDAVVGQYSMMSRILTAPITVISEAIRDVFRQRASKDYAERGECADCFKSTFKTLALVAIIPFVIIMFGAKPVLHLMFGDLWTMAGYFIMIMTPCYYVTFIVNPMTFMTYIAGKQAYDMKWQICFTASSIFAFTVGYFISRGTTVLPYVMIAFFGVSQAVMYGIYYFYAKKLSMGKIHKENE